MKPLLLPLLFNDPARSHGGHAGAKTAKNLKK